MASPHDGTFDNDRNCPSLPLPTLSQTMKRYLDSVRPLVTKDQFAITKKVCEDFERGDGARLHEKLQKMAATKRNWLTEWWAQGYLSIRASTAFYINFGGDISQFPLKELPNDQLGNAAVGLHVDAVMHNALRLQVYPADKNARGVPFMMEQYSRVFNACRIPDSPADKYVHKFRTSSEQSGEEVYQSNYFVVSINGHYFKIPAYSKTDVPLRPGSLRRMLAECESMAYPRSGQFLGALTTLDRDTWAVAHQRIRARSQRNAVNLRTIQESLKVMVLENYSPTGGLSGQLKEGLFGNLRNKWCDKPYQNVLFKDGNMKSCCDHTPAEGIIPVLISLQGSKYLDECRKNGRTADVLITEMDDCSHFPIEKLEFDLTEEDEALIKSADEKAIEFFNGLEVECVVFHGFGKLAIRERKYHPDAFVQVALQLAYYSLHGKFVATYETANTRQFYEGRTETVRSCTSESRSFCEAVVGGTTSGGELRRLLETAMEKQIWWLTEASHGQGVDRHLLGMQMLALEQGSPTPALYTDAGFTASGGGGNFLLSTSFTGYNGDFGGCAPMCTDGYGCFYAMHDERMYFFVAAYRAGPTTDLAKFTNSLQLALTRCLDISRFEKVQVDIPPAID